ncbi:hypothetical protein HispidOSU_027761 [Sigmodon hispidus]
MRRDLGALPGRRDTDTRARRLRGSAAGANSARPPDPRRVSVSANLRPQGHSIGYDACPSGLVPRPPLPPSVNPAWSGFTPVTQVPRLQGRVDLTLGRKPRQSSTEPPSTGPSPPAAQGYLSPVVLHPSEASADTPLQAPNSRPRPCVWRHRVVQPQSRGLRYGLWACRDVTESRFSHSGFAPMRNLQLAKGSLKLTRLLLSLVVTREASKACLRL